MRAGIYIFQFKEDITQIESEIKMLNTTMVGEVNLDAGSYAGLEVHEACRQRVLQELSGKSGLGLSPDLIDWDKAQFVTLDVDKESGADKEIHKLLMKAGYERVYTAKDGSTEMFNLGADGINTVLRCIKAIKTNTEFKKLISELDSFAPRKGSQDVCIEKAVQAYKTGHKKFLVGAKCRFGKTHTAYWIAKKQKAKNILILTYKPTDTEKEWNNATQHTDFYQYEFVNKNTPIEEIQALEHKVCFVSFQKFMRIEEQVELEEGGEASETFLSYVLSENWDTVIIDEDHYGADKDNGRKMIASVKSKFTLFLTGTPFNELLNNEFSEEETYIWDYVQEQEAKLEKKFNLENGVNAYADMAKINLITYNVNEGLEEKIQNQNGFSLSEMFAIKENKFVYELQIKAFIRNLFEDSQNPEAPTCALFTDYKLHDGLWRLPSVKACNLMKELLQEYLGDTYKVFSIVSPKDKNFKRLIGESTIPTISLTVFKGTTGLSVKKWNYIFMLSGSEDTTPQTYIQSMFRAQTPMKGKTQCYVVDFAPNRALKMMEFMTTVRCDSEKVLTDEVMERELGKTLNFMPLIRFDGYEATPMNTKEFIEELNSSVTAESLITDLIQYAPIGMKNSSLSFTLKDVAKNEVVGKVLREQLGGKKPSKEKVEKELTERDLKKQQKRFVENLQKAFFPIFVRFNTLSIDTVKAALNDERCLRFIATYNGIDEFEEFVGLLTLSLTDSRFVYGLTKTLAKISATPEYFTPYWSNALGKNKFPTPSALIKKMFDKVELKSTSKVLDPTCKVGEFLEEAISRGVAPKNCFAMCRSEWEFYLTSEKLIPLGVPKKNIEIVNIEQAGEALNMKFDIIIGNPPYDVHLKILEKIIPIGTKIVWLAPSTWLEDPFAGLSTKSSFSKYEKSIAKKIESIEIIDSFTAKKLFNSSTDFRTNLGIFCLTSSDKTEYLRFRENKIFSKFINNNIKVDIQTLSIDTEDIYSNFVPLRLWTNPNRATADNAYTQDGVVINKQCNNGYWKDTIYKGGKHINDNRDLIGINFQTEQEANNFYNSLNTFFVKYIVRYTRAGRNKIDIKSIPFMGDYTQPWTDERFYEYFELTPEEIEEIETTMAPYMEEKRLI